MCGKPCAKRHTELLDEVMRLADLHAQEVEKSRLRGRDIVTALTIREVDNIAAFKLAVHEKQMDQLYQWR